MQGFTHDRSNNLHFTITTSQKALGKGAQEGIMAFSTDSGHIQGSPNSALASFGNGGFLHDGGAGLMVGGIEAGKGDELAHIVKAGQGATFSQEFGCRQLAN